VTSCRPIPRRPPGALALIPAGQAALAAAQALARNATAPATLRAYKADWTHFAQWCAAHGFVARPRRAGDRPRLPRQPRRQLRVRFLRLEKCTASTTWYDRVRNFLVRRHKMHPRSVGPFTKEAVFGTLGVPRLRHCRRTGVMS
jgi:hypothetical protein